MERQLRNSKAILFPLLVTIILIGLSIGVANFLLGRIGTLRAEMQELEQKNQALSARLDTLQAVESQVTVGASVATLAIPPDNPAVLVTNILRSLAIENNVTLSKLSIYTVNQSPNAVDPNETVDLNPVNSTEVTFELTATEHQELSNFITALSTTKPILNLQSVKTQSNLEGVLSAAVSLTAYSSPLPTELPALDEPLSGLTAAEEETLAILEGFTSPNILSGEGVPVEVPPRDNPFVLGI